LPRDTQDPALDQLCRHLEESPADWSGFQLVVVVDASEEAASSWDDFLWQTFTRSDPATDSYGLGAFVQSKHWGCTGALVIDARLKSYHAPPLEPDPEVEKRVDELAAPGGPLHGLF
jgi:4-hydroxy-3-polyprenylbenzoate decarboxylase